MVVVTIPFKLRAVTGHLLLYVGRVRADTDPVSTGCKVADPSHEKGYCIAVPSCNNELDHDCCLGHATSPCESSSVYVKECGTITTELEYHEEDSPDVKWPACITPVWFDCLLVTTN